MLVVPEKPWPIPHTEPARLSKRRPGPQRNLVFISYSISVISVICLPAIALRAKAGG